MGCNTISFERLLPQTAAETGCVGYNLQSLLRFRRRRPTRYGPAIDFDSSHSLRVKSSIEPKDMPSVKPTDKWLLDDSSIFGDQVKERGRFSERNVSLKSDFLHML